MNNQAYPTKQYATPISNFQFSPLLSGLTRTESYGALKQKL